jgi:hypothetical protein
VCARTYEVARLCTFRWARKCVIESLVFRTVHVADIFLLSRTVFHDSYPCSAGRKTGSRDWTEICGIGNPFVYWNFPSLGITPSFGVGQALIARDCPFRYPNPLGRWFFGLRQRNILFPRGSKVRRIDIGRQCAGIGKTSSGVYTCIFDDGAGNDRV